MLVSKKLMRQKKYTMKTCTTDLRILKSLWVFTLAFVLSNLFLNNLANAEVEQATASKWELAGYSESTTPIKDHSAYRPLKRVLVDYASPEILEAMSSSIVGVEFISTQEMSNQNGEYDALLTRCGQTELFAAVNEVAWVHTYSAGVDSCMRSAEFNRLLERDNGLIVTNSSGTAATSIAEHSIAMMTSLSRGLHRYRDHQNNSNWGRATSRVPNLMQTITDKTMLVLGLGSIGQEVAKRADALGMRVIATRNSSRNGPDYVDYVGLANETLELASKADVVVNALPLTDSTRGFISNEFFAAMPENSYYISVGRGATTNTTALMKALESKKLAGAGLDVTDPEPLPNDHPLWKLDNVIITPHISGTGGEGREKVVNLVIENLRRYQAGEPMLNIVDTNLGY